MRTVCSVEEKHDCIRENDKFCWRCGAVTKRVEDLKCKHCEEPLSEVDKFCTNCGRPTR